MGWKNRQRRMGDPHERVTMDQALRVILDMKTTVFVRPNLKIFLLGAIAVVVVQHLIVTVYSQAQALGKPLPVHAREVNEGELQELIKYAIEKPSAEIYMRISHCFEK